MILYKCTSHSPESIGKLFSLIIRELEFASPLSLQHNGSSESYQTMNLGTKYQWNDTSSQQPHFIHSRFVLLVVVPWNRYRDIITFLTQCIIPWHFPQHHYNDISIKKKFHDLTGGPLDGANEEAISGFK